MTETTKISKVNKNLLWFEWMTNSISMEFNKYVSIKKTLESKNLRDIINNKIKTALDLLSLEEEIEKPFTKELVFNLYWSCLNEFTEERIVKVDSDSNLLKFEINDNVIVFISNSDLFYFKNKFKLFTQTDKYYSSWYYVKHKTQVSDELIKLYRNDFYNLQANVKLFLTEFGFNNKVQIAFSLLNKKRNELKIIHSEKNSLSKFINYDNVDLYDCKLMLGFLSLLIKTDISENRDKVNNYFSKKINYTNMQNPEFRVLGLLKKKFTYKNIMFFLIEYKPFQSAGNKVFRCTIKEKQDYSKYNENDQLKIICELNAFPINNESNYLNDITAKKITKIDDMYLWNQQ